MSDYLLIHGDARKLPVDLRSIDAIVSDPPYGIYACGGKWGHKKDLQWDRQPADGIADLVSGIPKAAIWGGNYLSLPPSRGWLVWYKRDSVPSASSVELSWTNRDTNSRLIDHTIAATNPERAGHPTQKPIRVMRWTIRLLNLQPDSLILDPYMGSGTTGIAALQEGHRFIGIDIERKYVEIARRRLERPHQVVGRPGKSESHPLFGEPA